MPSASAVSTSSSKTLGERVEPRPITGPEPSGWLPISFSSTPGASVAWVTSTAIAMSGRTSKAAVRAPKRPISSCTAATAAKEPPRLAALVGSGAGSPARRRRRGGCPSRGRRGARRRPRIGSAAITTGSPTRISSAASSRSAAPMSMCRPFSSTTFLRWSASSRWIGLRPTTPGTSPSLPRTSTRWPTRICGSQPPIGANQRKPFSSMWVTIRPISSMWPTTASSGDAVADPGDRGAEPVGAELGEGGGVAPDLGRGPLVAGGGAGAQKLVE